MKKIIEENDFKIEVTINNDGLPTSYHPISEKAIHDSEQCMSLIKKHFS